MLLSFKSHRPVIVIVDDETHILKALQRLTKNLPAECYFFNNSTEALGWIEANYADIIISDINMPYMNGIELLAKVSELIPESIRIVITGYAEPGLLDKVISQAHVWGYIEKPWDNAKFMAKVKSAIIYRQTIRSRLNELFAQLEKTASKADHDNRLKSEFLAMMSHEIRTPMTTVQGSLNLLSETMLSEKQQQHVKNASDAGATMLRLLGNILNYSKIESGFHRMSVKDVNIAELLTDTVSDYLPVALEKKLKIHCAIDDSIISNLYTDRDFVRQIVSNLIDNAIKFTNQGEINLSLEENEPGYLKIQVSDTGIGIAEDNDAEIFNKFTQILPSYNRTYDGSGLGLAICKQLVEKLGGEINYESASGHGSRFWFTIKDHQKPFDEVGDYDYQERIQFKSPVNDYSPLQSELDLLTQKTVLIVEDSSANQLIIRSMLESTGLKKILLASDGIEAIEMVEHNDVDLILMDLSMPRMDGATASRHIREQLNLVNLPIIALTANVEMLDIKHCLLSGMTDYVFKPVNKELLILSIAYYLNRDINHGVSSSEDEKVEALPKTSDLLNESSLEQLVVDTSEATMNKIVTMYIKEMTRRAASIESLCGSEIDIEGIGKEAHAIKSSSSTLGAVKASVLAKNLEQCCKDKNVEPILSLAERLLSALEHSKQALTNYIER